MVTSRREPSREERESLVCQAVKERQTILVIEPPLNYKMVFDGPTNMAAPKASVAPMAMSLFPHARGASVCAPLYEHYIAEDGRCYHLYHTSKVVCEVLDPGAYPIISAPTELRHVLREKLPKSPPPDYPSGAKDAKPMLYLPPSRPCPQVDEHYVPLCAIACRQVHGDKSCPGPRCRMFGAMPSDFLVFEVSEEQAEEKSVSQETQPSEADVNWDLSTSIFAPRRKEAESRSFWDTERLIKKALDVDYGRMLKEERVLRLISKTDAAVVRGEKTAKESLEEVKNAIAPSYRTFLSVFNFYCVTPSSSTRGAFSIQPNQFTRMMQDADLAGNYISAEEVGKTFVLVNFESDKGSFEAVLNEDRALMRFELMEALLRIAIAIRDNQCEDEVSPAEKLREIINDCLLANLPSDATDESNAFREACLYNQDVDNTFRDHQKALTIVYQRYSMLDPVAGKPSFGLEEWKILTSEARLIGDQEHMLRLGFRESKLPFYRARMIFSDEMKSHSKRTELTFVDFLEALARLAAVIPLPSDEEMKKFNVTDILDYEAAISNNSEHFSIHSGSAAVMPAHPLAPRLDRLLRFVLGNLAVRSNGVLKAGNKGMHMVGQYCTKEHLVRGVLPY